MYMQEASFCLEYCNPTPTPIPFPLQPSMHINIFSSCAAVDDITNTASHMHLYSIY